MLSEPAAVTLKVIETLDALNIPYLIGGSFASAIHGVARMTADSDLVVDMRLDQVDPFVRSSVRCRAHSTWMRPRCAKPFVIVEVLI